MSWKALAAGEHRCCPDANARSGGITLHDRIAPRDLRGGVGLAGGGRGCPRWVYGSVLGDAEDQLAWR
jgi:hypothetical protein